MSEIKHIRLAKALRITGRVIGLVVVIFFLAFGIGEGIMSIQEEGFQGIDIGVVILFAPVVIALAGLILSWWWLLPAGAILVVAYILWGVHPLLYLPFAEESNLPAGPNWGEVLLRGFTSNLGIPYLISGVLFIISWWLPRRARSSTTPPSPM